MLRCLCILRMISCKRILKNESCPAAFCDLEAFDQNLKWLGKALESTNKKVRLGTKSIRIPALINRALQQPYVNGLMIFHPNEIQYWQENFDVIDFLLAYPIITETDAINCVLLPNVIQM